MSSWPCRIAAIIAVPSGIMMILMGGGHLSAIIGNAMANDVPFNFRLVSLLTTGGMLVLPGILSVVMSYWIWKGRNWAFATCTVSTTMLMIYLTLLMYMKANDPAGAPSVGTELYIASIIVGSYLVVLGVSWSMHMLGNRSAASPA